MELLKTLGFDPIMLGAQILNFLIIFYVLKRFLYKPVMDMIKKREDIISLGVKQAQEASDRLEKATEEERKILSKAQEESKLLIDEAKTEAQRLSQEMEENARLQTQKIFADTKEQLNQEGQEIEKRISQKVSILAVEMLTSSLKGIFTDKDQKAIVEKALKKVKRVD